MKYNINDIHAIKVNESFFLVSRNEITPESTNCRVVLANSPLNKGKIDILFLSQKALDALVKSEVPIEVYTKEQVEKNLKEFEDMELMK